MVELNVVVRLRIMPENPDVDLEKIRKEASSVINKTGKVHSIETTPIAFGISALDVVFLLNDAAGGMEEIEKKLSKVSGVGEVSVGEISRL